jgi:hypothetical protein
LARDPRASCRFGQMVGTMAGGRTYWLDLFTGKTWDEFLKAGGRVTGFRERRWKTLQRMKAGDYPSAT